MKICFVGNTAPESVHVIRWVKWFVDRGHDVYVVSPSYNVLDNTIHCILEDESTNGILSFYNKMNDTKIHVKKIKPDVVHGFYAFGYGTFAAYSGFHPFLLTTFGSDILVDTKTFFKRHLIKYTLRKADMITCDAHHMEYKIYDLIKSAGKIRHINFGIDMDQFKPKKSKHRDYNVVISTRNLNPIYDVMTFVNAMPLVLEEVPNARFIIAGDGIMKESLKEQVNYYGIRDNVAFTGFLNNEIMPDVLNMSDVYVSTSLSDAGLSCSTAEAMACGLPVVVTDFGENKYWVKDGDTGYVFTVWDYKKLAEKLVHLLTDDKLRRNCGRNARKLVKEKLDFDKEMQKVEKLYEELVK